MSIDVKEIREGAGEAEETLANAATGAIVSVVDAATDPVGTVRKTVRRLEKRGEPVNRRIERRVEKTADMTAEATLDVVSGNLAERLALAGIRIARDRSRKRDVLGDALYRGVEMLHRGLGWYADELGKFRLASEPPTRYGERRSPARRSSRAQARRTSTARTRTAATSRRSRTARSRTATRRSA